MLTQLKTPRGMGATGRSSRRGFALTELMALVVVCIAAAALLAVATKQSHRLSSLSESIANLKRFGEGTASYASDNQDVFYAFSWRHDRIGPTNYADLRAQAEGSDDLGAHAAQAVDILRRKTGRNIERIDGWVACVYYTHLVLADYNGESLPAWWAISPEDKNRLLWASDPTGFDAGRFSPSPNPLSPRWPYSSSYERAMCASTWDYGSATRGSVSQAGSHNLFTVNAPFNGGTGNAFADRRIAEVTYPSAKALMWDSAQRHHGVLEQYWMYPDSRIPVLFVDGDVRVRATGNSNSGFDPASPRSMFYTSVGYTPAAWEPPPRNTGPSDLYLRGRFRFTRSGLGGRDFDADEVPVQ